MQKTIFITGSTDGIGLETAKKIATKGHHVILHGRNSAKLEKAQTTLSEITDSCNVDSYLADLSDLTEVTELAKAITKNHTKLDVLINNAGIFKTSSHVAQEGLDVRFIVNTLAPYLLTQKLLPLLKPSARVINLSSAAQSPVNPEALAGRIRLHDDFDAYAQSKLALTMWSRSLALYYKAKGPIFIAINPGSMLGTKMVKEGFGVAGNNIAIGADILVRAALADEFKTASGQYFDNDSGQLASPHPDALDPQKCEEIMCVIETTLGHPRK